MPGYDEIADIDVINGNMDKIDVQMKKNADSAQQSKDIVSDEYSATSTYAVGDYCIHENVLYKCKTAITTGEAFDSNKWIRTTCGTEFGELNSNLDALEYSDVAGGKNLWDECYEFVSLNLVSKNYIKVKPNTLYKITCSKLFNVHKYDSNYNFLGNPSYNSISSGYTFQTDSDTSYIKFEIHSSYGSAYNHDIAVLEGASGTYEPYIPSVKMLAEENTQQSTETMDLKMLGWTVPSECPVQNYVDSDGVFHKIVGRVDLGSLDWYYTSNRFYTVLEGGKRTANYNGVDAYCDKYNNAKDKDYSTFDNKEFSIGSNFASNSTCAIVIRDDSYTDATTFKNSLKGVYLYYELETPITMTIDGNEAVTQIKNDLGGLSLSVSGTTLSITDGTNTWTLEAN